jgi:hypothetical protein
MSKYSEAGKGSTNKLKQKSLYDENYEKIWGNKKNKLYEERYYDSDESNDWDYEKIEIILQNENSETHYFED